MNASEEFWDILCAYDSYFYLMLVVVTVMGVLNGAAMALGEQSEGAFVVSLLVFGILGLTGGGLAVVLWQCNRRSP
ncbi:hypothetical protein [Natrinema amylolyticum]|uniref:hypothetical protein n=1 Tax=Natrinema amylolyticum TaxID=2878679 RepID=UPI001CF95157|nr:hypothetical protein [Natrinema amylolyticum]